jgi:hypothetical protein
MLRRKPTACSRTKTCARTTSISRRINCHHCALTCKYLPPVQIDPVKYRYAQWQVQTIPRCPSPRSARLANPWWLERLCCKAKKNKMRKRDKIRERVPFAPCWPFSVFMLIYTYPFVVVPTWLAFLELVVVAAVVVAVLLANVWVEEVVVWAVVWEKGHF